VSIDCIKTKKGRSWRVRLYCKTGRRVSKCFQRKVDAEHWEAEARLQLGKSHIIRTVPIKFSVLAERFLQFQKFEIQPSTLQKYEGHLSKYLLPHFGGLMSDQITKSDIMNFKVHLSGMKVSDALKHQVFSLLKTVFKRSVEWDLIQFDPTHSVRAPKKGNSRIEYWYEYEATRFLEGMRTHPRFLVYLLALNTGMRAGEIFGLKWDSVDFENRLITIRRTFDQKTREIKETTKNHKWRHVGINSVLMAALSKALPSNGFGTVIDREVAGCQSPAHIAREFAADCKRVGVRRIKFHDLRHTFATQFVGRGGAIHALSGILGHSSSSMTDRYAHFTPEHARKSAEVVSFGLASDTCGVQIQTGSE
jgi:integrase